HERKGEQAQVVPCGDVVRAARRGEDEVEGREELKREAQREPLGEIVSRLREAAAPADDGEEVEERLHGERGGEAGGSVGHARQRGQRREAAAVGAKEEPGSNECDRRCDERVAKGTVTCSAAAADERCDRDE